MPSTFLIVGATGKQGGAAVSYILSQNASDVKLKFITRNADSSSAQALVKKGLEPVKADLSDKASLVSALKGVDRAFLMTDALAGEEKETLQGVTFIDAAKEAGVTHLVFTSVGAADTAPNVPHFRSKAKIEEHLKASGLSYTILRPMAFLDNFPTAPGVGRFFAIGLFYSAVGWKPVGMIAVRDIGVFAGKALLEPESPDFKGKTIDLSIGSVGLDDYTVAIQKAQGHTPWFARYGTRAVRRLLPYDFRQMMIWYPAGDVANLKRIHPGLTSLEDFFKLE